MILNFGKKSLKVKVEEENNITKHYYWFALDPDKGSIFVDNVKISNKNIKNL